MAFVIHVTLPQAEDGNVADGGGAAAVVAIAGGSCVGVGGGGGGDGDEGGGGGQRTKDCKRLSINTTTYGRRFLVLPS